METLAQRLKLARTNRKMTQGELAEASGVGQAAISKIEGGSTLQTPAIARLASALKVPVEWLDQGLGPEPDWDAPLRYAAAEQLPAAWSAPQFSLRSASIAERLDALSGNRQALAFALIDFTLRTLEEEQASHDASSKRRSRRA